MKDDFPYLYVYKNQNKILRKDGLMLQGLSQSKLTDPCSTL